VFGHGDVFYIGIGRIGGLEEIHIRRWKRLTLGYFGGVFAGGELRLGCGYGAGDEEIRGTTVAA
jgi:hypothetical protein